MPNEILRAHGWLSHQPATLQDQVLAMGRIRRYPRGSMVYCLGDPPGGIFGILNGSIAVTIAPGSTGPHLVHLATPGWWFGEGCFLTGQPRRIGLEASVDSALFYLPLEAMERLAAADPENIRRFSHISMMNIDLSLRVIDGLLMPDPDRRIAATLVRCVGTEPQGTIEISQTALGRIANASRKVVNRALARLEGEGLVIAGYARITVPDVAALKRFAHEEGPQG